MYRLLYRSSKYFIVIKYIFYQLILYTKHYYSQYTDEEPKMRLLCQQKSLFYILGERNVYHTQEFSTKNALETEILEDCRKGIGQQ